MSRTFKSVRKGTEFTKDFRIYFIDENSCPVSPFHDIPLKAGQLDNGTPLFNMVVEIPRWTNAKLEICKELPLNPIKQDIKKDKLRFVNNVFPHRGYIWNYGALPQTWEDPHQMFDETGYVGDNDPVDVCEIGSKIHAAGSVIRVKVLGILAMIDEGETDWKVMAIDVDDPMADEFNNIDDVERLMPEFLNGTRDWFRRYKIPQDKPANTFALNGEYMDKEYALRIIEDSNVLWNKLVNHEIKDHGLTLSQANTQNEGSPYKIEMAAAQEIINKEPDFASNPNSEGLGDDKWYFV